MQHWEKNWPNEIEVSSEINVVTTNLYFNFWKQNSSLKSRAFNESKYCFRLEFTFVSEKKEFMNLNIPVAIINWNL